MFISKYLQKKEIVHKKDKMLKDFFSVTNTVANQSILSNKSADYAGRSNNGKMSFTEVENLRGIMIDFHKNRMEIRKKAEKIKETKEKLENSTKIIERKKNYINSKIKRRKKVIVEVEINMQKFERKASIKKSLSLTSLKDAKKCRSTSENLVY
jgi:hypothetical protein